MGKRRSWAFALLAALVVAPVGASGQDRYPSQAVTLIMPFTAGGGSDIVTRALGAEMSKLLGQSFVVVNRDGAAGVIGFAALAQAKPDGYTLASSPATPITNVPHLQKELAYTFDSFVPICQTFENVFAVVVPPSSAYKTLADLLEAARASPGKLAYGSVGTGSIPHLSVAALAKATGVQVQHVPYRGDAQMLPNLLSGELAFGSAAISSISGRGLRVLAVVSDTRHPSVPDAPAVTELGVPYIQPGLNGLFAVRGTPQSVLDVLERACQQATATEAFRAQVGKLDQTVAYLGAGRLREALAGGLRVQGPAGARARFEAAVSALRVRHSNAVTASLSASRRKSS
jgi:tripartite-type tricarboxylate transporter receptor subunit TctC